MGAGNSFFTYCHDLHVCRMAGCHSILADLLDEHALSMFHAVKLVKEVLKLDATDVSFGEAVSELASNPLSWLERTDEYLELVSQRNLQVFDLRSRCFKPLVSVQHLQ